MDIALTQPLRGALTSERSDATADAEKASARLGALYKTHHKAVFRAAWRVTGDAQDAEDVLQTVFLRLARPERQPDLDNPAAYLHRAAINAALDLKRSRKRRPSVPLATPGGQRMAEETNVAEQSGDGAPMRAASPETQELRERLRTAVAQLHPRTGEIFALRYFQGYGNREIAELLGTTENTIGVTLYRARKQLRDVLENGQAVHDG